MTIILIHKGSVVILKKKNSTICAFLCLCTLVLSTGLSVSEKVSSCVLYDDVLRMHIIANSDSEWDQSLKYKVRDCLRNETEGLFAECKNISQALAVAENSKELLQRKAKAVLEKNGCSDKVRVLTGRKNYPEKVYDGIVFPEGEYLSVRVIIGDGNGRNWWCVLFPSVCGFGAKEEDDESRNNRGTELFGCRIKLGILEYFA